MAFLEDLELDVTGQKLYANYRGAGNIVVINAEELVARVDIEFNRQRGNVRTSEFKGQKYALDKVGYQDEVVGLFSEQHPLDALYLPAIGVARPRSEERRGGRECGRRSGSRW